MKNIILIAPPAAGKGTLSEYLKTNLGYTHVSVGDLLKQDESLQELIKTGVLLNDEIVFNTLKAKLNKLDNTPYILDGFPRTLPQAEMYENYLKEEGKDLGVVIYLDVDKEILKKRVTTRKVCPKCFRSYSGIDKNLFPKNEGLCDDCNENLITRPDDTLEVFENRYNEYMTKTYPLIKHFEEKGVLGRIKEESLEEIIKQTTSLIK